MLTRSSNPENHENLHQKCKNIPVPRGRSFGTDLTNQSKQDQVSKVESFSLEYLPDIFQYLHSIEEKFMPKPGYMLTQDSINEKMRSILIDWLVEVHHKFKLVDETLFLTVNLIDRYLSKASIAKENLQLIGVSSMLIACKYEEIYAPEVKDFVFITDSAYTAEQVLENENKILRTLDFDVTVPSSLRFLQRYCKVCEFDEVAFYFSRYVLELSLVDYKFVKYKPSNIAASSMYVAQKVLKFCARNLSEQTTCSDSEIRTCAKDLMIMLKKAESFSLQAVRKKFSHEKYFEASKVPVKF
jgi:cyclin B